MVDVILDFKWIKQKPVLPKAIHSQAPYVLFPDFVQRPMGGVPVICKFGGFHQFPPVFIEVIHDDKFINITIIIWIIWTDCIMLFNLTIWTNLWHIITCCIYRQGGPSERPCLFIIIWTYETGYCKYILFQLIYI